MKFGKNYKLTIQNNPGTEQSKTALEIDYPLTIEFDINRAIGGVLKNNATIKISNLSLTTRSTIVKDRFNIPILDSGAAFRLLSLEAGYGKNIYPIFAGNILEAYSQRVGTEAITNIYAVSGAYGIFNANINQTYGANTKRQKVLDDLVNTLVQAGQIEKGAITPIDGEFKTGYTAFGNSFDLITEQFGYVFVDLNKINMLSAGEVLDKLVGGRAFLINSESGLLGTPERRSTFVEVRMMFEPQIQLGQIVEIQSETDPRFNGQYKVYGINHNGVISGAVDKPTITTLQLWIGNNLINGFKTI